MTILNQIILFNLLKYLHNHSIAKEFANPFYYLFEMFFLIPVLIVMSLFFNIENNNIIYVI